MMPLGKGRGRADGEGGGPWGRGRAASGVQLGNVGGGEGVRGRVHADHWRALRVSWRTVLLCYGVVGWRVGGVGRVEGWGEENPTEDETGGQYEEDPGRLQLGQA